MKTLTYKLPLYPTKEQQATLWEWSRALNSLYNHYIELQKDRLRKNQSLLGRYDMQNLIPTLKNEIKNLNKVYADARQQCAFRADNAITKWRRRQSSFPHFRSGYQFYNIIYGCFEKSCKLKGGYFKAHKLPPIKVNIYRELQGNIKTASVHCDSAGKWWLLLTSRYNESEMKFIHLDKIVGIDLGCKNLLATSDGYTIRPPKFLKRMDSAIRDLQSRVNTYHKPTGSKKNHTYHESRTCRRLKKTIRRLYGKRARMMKNFLHTRSRKIVDHYDVVIVEKLEVKKLMMKGKRQNKPESKNINRIMSQNAVSMFNNMLHYKAKQYLEVTPTYTSQTCAQCGQMREDLTLADRTYKCSCGLELDRDVNAALNIRNLGLLRILNLSSPQATIQDVAKHLSYCNDVYPTQALA